MSETEAEITGADAILRSLKTNGIERLFVNPGSDFAPVIEAYAKAGAAGPEDGAAIPAVTLAPHENICVAMAHGWWLATGEMQAAMVHVNVGLANAAMGMLNAHADDAPILLMSGRTPVTEHDREGARRTPIQYGQELFDQSALVRETVKWDYELRYAENAADLVSRAAAIARSAPEGGVYLSLPREPLCERTPPPGPAPVQIAAAPPAPDPDAIARAAAILAAAKSPLVICCRGDAEGRVAAELTALAEEAAIPVAEVFVTRNLMATDHPMMIGHDTARHLPEADAVLVVDSGVAWVEAKAQPAPGAEVIHLGPDPLFARMPVRSYRTTLAIQTEVAAGLSALRAALKERSPGADEGKIAERRTQIAARHRAFIAAMDEKARPAPDGRATKAFAARAVSAVLGDDGVVFNERGGPAATFMMAGPNRWFGNTQAGGLGWGLPAALGYQLARPDRLVVAMIGDGSYLFANPPACWQVALAEGLAPLVVVLDNAGYDAVRLSAGEVYPGGAALSANRTPMTRFAPGPDHAAAASAAGVAVWRAPRAEELQDALEAAVRTIRTERRPCLIALDVAPE